jgi:hypothetical protein
MAGGRRAGSPTIRLPKVTLDRNRLPFVPRNEAGVAVLFGMFAGEFGMRITDAQYGFPDVTVEIAGRRCGVELEFRSRSFRTHVVNRQHRRGKCELVVCWQHDWPGLPEALTVLELRKVFGIGQAVWIVPMYAQYADRLPSGRAIADYWSVPSKSGPDDLLLIYRPGGNDMYVKDIMRLRSPVEHVRAGWRKGLDWMGSVQRVATLTKPLSLADLRAAGVSSKSLQGRPDITTHWPDVRIKIVALNPEIAKQLPPVQVVRGRRRRTA